MERTEDISDEDWYKIKMTKGIKYDQEKIRIDLIPPELIEQVGKILTLGLKKYEERNWECGMDWGRYYGALQRHLWSWWKGEDKDPETNESHLSHAACCLAFLIAYEQRQIGKDTRNKIKGNKENVKKTE